MYNKKFFNRFLLLTTGILFFPSSNISIFAHDDIKEAQAEQKAQTLPGVPGSGSFSLDFSKLVPESKSLFLKPSINSNDALLAPPPNSARSSTPMFYEEPQVIPDSVIQNPSLFPTNHVPLNSLELQVSCISIIDTPSNEFNIDVTIVNRSNQYIPNIKVYIAISDEESLSLIQPIPRLDLTWSLFHNEKHQFSYRVRATSTDTAKRTTFCVYATQTLEDNGASVEYLLAKHKQQIFFTESPPKKAIIIVPGICGSELFSSKAQRVGGNQYSKGYRIWPPEGAMPLMQSVSPSSIIRMDSNRLIRDLSLIYCNEDGSSQADIMTSNPVLDCRINPNNRLFGTANCYGALVSAIVSSQDFLDKEIVFFSYDWRKSNAETAQSLENFINNQHYTEVSLVAHSMGSLLCCSYLSNDTNCEKVKQFITLGAPFLGAPKAFAALQDGVFFDGIVGQLSGPVARPIVKKLTKNCLSAYELLPPEQMFSHISEGYLEKFNQYYKWFKKDLTSIQDYPGTLEAINSLNISQNAMDKAENAQLFHDSLYNESAKMKAISRENVAHFNIVGYNSKTINKFQLKYHHGAFKCINNTFYSNGDGTVPLISATLNWETEEKNAYYIKNVDHLGLVSDTDTLGLVCNILADEPEMFNPTHIRKDLHSEEFVSGGCIVPLLRGLSCSEAPED